MLPTLNGKSFLDCNEEDLQELIDNPDYRENEYLDYKAAFAFLEMDKKNPERQGKIVEFRNDVCAFANAGGGYLIYGISDVKGMAKEIVGIEIPNNNTDKFELERKNNLAPIMPKMPSLQFGYIPLENGRFVVVIQIHRDDFTPYLHLENEMNYMAYKRVGNGKTPIGYVELKNMFNQSLSIENEIQAYRQRRIAYYRSQEDTEDKRYSQFMLVHVIPDTFIDSSYRKNMFILQRKNPRLSLGSIFNNGYNSQPNADGLRFPDYRETAVGLLTNQGIAEYFAPLMETLYPSDKHPYGYFPCDYHWEQIEKIVKKYISIMKSILETKRLFICISVLGCKGVTTNDSFERYYKGHIDRDTVLCVPISINDIDNETEVDNSIKWLKIEYYLSLGIKANDELDKLVAEVIDDDNH